MLKSSSARMYVALVAISGLLVLGNAVFRARGMPTGQFVSFLLVACLASRLKIKLPGLTGTMSVNLPFILLATAEMSAIFRLQARSRLSAIRIRLFLSLSVCRVVGSMSERCLIARGGQIPPRR